MTTKTPTPPSESALQSIASYCVTAITVLFVFSFVFQNFVIPSSSMASTLLVGDHVFVDRASLAPEGPHILSYRPLRRGEPVVFFKPILDSGEVTVLVKRVVGLPGDRIHLRAGILYLNGVAQNEPFAAKPNGSNYDSYRDDFPSIQPENVPRVTARWTLDLPTHIQGEDLVVPPDSYFMMGDNRTNSLDGRYWGFVPRANLIGRPLFVYWSIDVPEQNGNPTTGESLALMFHELTHFATATRWSRTFHPVS
jgi:signal peptidase I